MATVLHTKTHVLLIGYENQENLGLRSIIACLHDKGYTTLLVPFFPGKDYLVLDEIKKHKPLLIGFSLIF